MLLDRPEYIEKLKLLQNKSDLIKIITGARRSGKSKILDLFKNYLEGIGVKKVISINFEDLKNEELLDYKKLHTYILESILKNEINYVFLDEIQLVSNWVKTVNSLRLNKDIDLYITGSNTNMMDDDIHNELGGRWMEIKVMPLSLKEFASWQKLPTVTLAEYNKYITQSGFPETFEFNGKQTLINDYLSNSVHKNTIQRDIKKKYNVSDTKLDDLIKYIFDNIGKETSLLNIEKYLKNYGRKIDADTIKKYIKWLQNCFMIYKCERYDIRGKKLLSTNAKYYVVDTGLRHAILGHQDRDIGYTLENVVYLELLRRGYIVYSGKIGKKTSIDGEEVMLEVDFVAEKNGYREYYQVSWSVLGNERTSKREYASLEELKDNYPKYLLTTDIGQGGQNGINRLNVLDWLVS